MFYHLEQRKKVSNAKVPGISKVDQNNLLWANLQSGHTDRSKQHYCVSVKVRIYNGKIYRHPERAIEMTPYIFESPLIESIIQIRNSQFTICNNPGFKIDLKLLNGVQIINKFVRL